MTDEEQIEERLQNIEATLCSLMDIIYDYYKQKNEGSDGDSQVFKLLKDFDKEIDKLCSSGQ